MGWERRRMEEGVYGRGAEESGGGSVWGVGEEKESGEDGRSAGCRGEEDRGVQGECKKDERNMGHKVRGREICLAPKLLGGEKEPRYEAREKTRNRSIWKG